MGFWKRFTSGHNHKAKPRGYKDQEWAAVLWQLDKETQDVYTDGNQDVVEQLRNSAPERYKPGSTALAELVSQYEKETGAASPDERAAALAWYQDQLNHNPDSLGGGDNIDHHRAAIAASQDGELFKQILRDYRNSRDTDRILD